MACKYTYKEITYNSKEEFINQVINPQFLSNQKIRRVMEVQSDLFQKGRNADELIGSESEILYELDRMGKPDSTNPDDIAEARKRLSTSNQNQFLQLLNKDNNWVKFFISAIIQDSAKKGYEKVLFPKGETAAKIEGHETIADEIRRVDIEIESIKKGRLGFDKTELGKEKEIKTGQKIEEILFAQRPESNRVKEFEQKGYITNVRIDIDTAKLEAKEQEKANLKSQGIEKLKPIEVFYEIKVGNILEKQFGKENVKTITDEYGNQWREITINQARDLDNILLQKNEANRIIGQANIKAMTVLVDAVNKKEDTIPHEYAHHYIAWFRNTPIVQEAIKRFGSEEALVQAIGEQVVKQKGEAYNWWKKFTNWILNLLSDKQLLQVLTDSFLNRQDLHDFTYNQPNTQQKQQAIEIYSKYLDTIFPDSKVRGIVYHGSSEKREILDPTKQVRGRFGQGVSFAATPQLVNQLIDDAIMHYALIDLKNPLTDIPSFRADVQPAVEQGNHDGVQVGNIEFTVPTKEQIHILGSKQDIEGFKKFTKRQSNDINNQENNNIEQSQINENNTESFTKESLNKKIDELLKSGEIYYTDDDSKPCAANGLRNTVKGTDWKIATEFKGKSHAQGGIDITLNENGYHFRRGGKDIKAANGLIIENK